MRQANRVYDENELSVLHIKLQIKLACFLQLPEIKSTRYMLRAIEHSKISVIRNILNNGIGVRCATEIFD